jgi:hypothetical protein
MPLFGRGTTGEWRGVGHEPLARDSTDTGGLATLASVTAPRQSDWLLIISEREALAWVLREGQMAFPQGRDVTARQLAIDDRLFLYTTRLCFHNPTRDRGRVIGVARVATDVRALTEPLHLVGREFSTACSLDVVKLAPLRTGVELSPIVALLRAFPDVKTWSARMRQPLLALAPADARIIERRLRPYLRPVSEVIDDYLALA